MNDFCEWTGQGQAASAENRETIFALASGAGVAGVAVIRISGPGAARCLAELTRRPLPEARRAVLRRLLGEDGDLLDEALVLRFEPGASFTGEEVVELHCHGGVAIVSRVLDRLAGLAGCRLAEPGEFTRRAFEAGRMDLAEVEALGDLLAAETEAQRKQAMRGYGGALHRLAERWRQGLVRALALIEVTIDWADEEVPEEVGPEVDELVSRVVAEIGREIAGSASAEQLRAGFEVALVGAPNAGKSSLLNALAGREAAITSPSPGTTRDVIELRFDLNGLPVVFLDMAGLRETKDEVEAIGVRLARRRAEAAAVRVFLDAPDAVLGELGDGLRRDDDIVVPTKTDLSGLDGVCTLTGAGVDRLLTALRERLERETGEAGLVGRLRQRKALEQSRDILRAALAVQEPELKAEELRGGLRALERLIGRVGTEDVLGEVFSAFCVGK